MLTLSSLDAIAHVIQISLTPVFLLSGVAALLNVFAARLARVADQADALISARRDGEPTDEFERRLRRLRLRSTALDWAVVLVALAGAMSCGAILVLFLGALRGAPAGAAALLLFALFGGAVVVSMGALFAFVLEMLLAGHGVRRVTKRRLR